MTSATTWATFLSASFLLAIAPGPGIMYVLTRSLAGGRREGIICSLGTLVGGFVHVMAAGLGISVILATSAVAFQAVRWAGALYLIYMGVRMFRSAGAKDHAAEVPAVSGNAFGQGIVTKVLNPKNRLVLLVVHPSVC